MQRRRFVDFYLVRNTLVLIFTIQGSHISWAAHILWQAAVACHINLKSADIFPWALISMQIAVKSWEKVSPKTTQIAFVAKLQVAMLQSRKSPVMAAVLHMSGATSVAPPADHVQHIVKAGVQVKGAPKKYTHDRRSAINVQRATCNDRGLHELQQCWSS